jgi:HK97 family phage major capsid protein
MPVTVPTTSEELADLLMNKKKLDEVYSDPTAFGEFLTNYAAASNKANPEIGQKLDERIEQGIASFLKNNSDAKISRPTGMIRPPSDGNPAKAAQRAANYLYNAKALGAKLDHEFADTADFLKTIWNKTDRSDPAVAKKIDTLRNALSSSVPSDGGFLIPETLRSQVLEVALETAIVRPRSMVIPMESLRVPIPAIDSTSNVSSVFGGIVGYWTEEAAALTASQPAFGRVVLDAKKLTCYVEAPNELMADSIVSFEALINRLFPRAIAWYEDYAFLTGTGAGEPLGVLNAGNAALVAVTKETNQNAATILWENLVKMYSRMLPGSLGSAVWLASIDTFPELATMALSVGTGGSAVWMGTANGALSGAATPPVTILGRPVIFTEKTSVLGTQGDISFIDFGNYLLGDRQVMQATSSTDYKFANDMTAFRFIERVDGRPWMKSAITPKNNGPTLSAYVTLATRS